MQRLVFIGLLLSLFTRPAFADDCVVERETGTGKGTLGWAVQQAAAGNCLVSSADLNRQYQDFFPEALQFSLIRFQRSMDLEISTVLKIQNARAEPLVLRATADQVVSWRAAASTLGPELSGSKIILDGLRLLGFTQRSLSIRSTETLLIHSRFIQGTGVGISLGGHHNWLVDSEIAYHPGSGVVVEDQRYQQCVTSQDFSASLLGLSVHHNGSASTEAGVAINLGEVLVDAWNLHGDNKAQIGREISSEGFRLAVGRIYNNSAGVRINSAQREQCPSYSQVSRTALYGNQAQDIVIPQHALPAPQNLSMKLLAEVQRAVFSGALTLRADDPMWSPAQLSTKELEVDVYAGREDARMHYIGTAHVFDAVSGQFILSVALSDLPEEIRQGASQLAAVTVSRSLHHVSALPATELSVPVQNPVDEVPPSTEPSNPAPLDTDGDGADDAREVRGGTLIDVCDTDGDGLSDGIEYGIVGGDESIMGCHGLYSAGSNFHQISVLDPQNTDSDADGLSDGEEDANANGWLDLEETDPTRADTDGDGLSDGEEMHGDLDGDGLPDFDYRLVVGAGQGCVHPTSLLDLDCDSLPNANDTDSDGDLCADQDESHDDSNNNGIPDVFDPQAKQCESSSSSAGASLPASGAAPTESASDQPRKKIQFGNMSEGGACQLVMLPQPNSSSAAILLMFAGVFCGLQLSRKYGMK